MKKLISTICIIVLCFLNLNITATFAADFSEANFTISLVNCEKANLYFEGETPSVRIKLSNNQDVDLSGKYTCAVTTPGGAEVFTAGRDITLSGKTDKTFGETLDIGDIGVYTLTVTLGGDFGGVAKSVKFAILQKSDARNDKIGTGLHFDLDVRDDKLDETHALTDAGSFGWVRDDLRWQRMQSEAGGAITVPAYRDAEINAHLEAGNKVLLILAYGNTNYGDRFPQTDDEIKAYAAYCKAVATHYKGKIDTFEIYNEPDYSGFAGWEITGADYVKVLKAAAEAIRDPQPEATIVAGALCSMRTPTARARTIATQIFSDPTVTNYMSAFSFHCYDYSHGAYSDEDTVTNFDGQIEFIKGLLQNTTKPNLPIWITEDGMPSEGLNHTNEIIQAEDTARVLASVAANPQVERYFIYNLHEKTHSTVMENAFGLVDENYEPKPAYAAAAFSNKILSGAECVYKFEGDTTAYKGDALGGYGYKSDDKEIYVAWAHTGKTATLQISKTRPAGSETAFSKLGSTGTVTVAADADVKIYDMYGNRLDYKSNISLTSAPVYVEVAPSKISFERNGNSVTVKGYSDTGNSDVTLIATDKENTENILALKQIKSSDTGEFIFNVEIPADKSFYIYVYDGSIKESADYGNVDFSVTPQLFINQSKEYDLDDLNDGDTVILSLDASVEDASKNLIFYGAVYKNSGVLLKADKKELSFVDGKASAQIEFFIENSEDIKNIKYMLWDENLSPLTGAVTFE